MKTLNYSQEKFEAKIEEHFKNVVHKYCENNEMVFKIAFTEVVHANTYDFDFEYDCIFTGVYYKEEITCTCENRLVELTLVASNYNPDKPSLYQRLQKIIEDKEEELAEDYTQSQINARYIEETNDLLNLNNR